MMRLVHYKYMCIVHSGSAFEVGTTRIQLAHNEASTLHVYSLGSHLFCLCRIETRSVYEMIWMHVTTQE